MADLLNIDVPPATPYRFVPSAAHDIPALRAEVKRLSAEVKRLSVAKYVTGPEGCVRDRECGEYWDADGGAADVEWCSHVEHRVATAEDAIRLERVRDYLRDIDPETAPVEDVRDALDWARRAAFDEIDD